MGCRLAAAMETHVESPVPKTDDPSATPPALPRISDYWPDAPQRLGPPADHYELPGVDATRTGPALHTRPVVEDPAGTRWIGDPDGRVKRDWKPVALLVVVAILAGAGVFAAVSYARSDRGTPDALPAPPLPAPTAEGTPPATPPVSIGTSPPSAAVSASPTKAAPPPAVTTTPPVTPSSATFELFNGVTQLQVEIGDVDGGFFKVGVGDDTTISAKAVFDDGTLKVSVTPNGKKSGSARVEVLLSDEVKWSFRMRGGVSEAGVDLSGGKVGAIELIGGAATMDIALPDQMETIPIVERGGIGTWRIVTDDKETVRAFFRNGAGKVTLYGDTDKTVDKGDTIRNGDDADVKIDAEGGVGALTVQSR